MDSSSNNSDTLRNDARKTPDSSDSNSVSDKTGNPIGNRDEEQLNDLSLLMAEELLKNPKPAWKKRSGCFTIFIFSAALVMVLLILGVNSLLRFIKTDFMSDYSIISTPVMLSQGEKDDLKTQSDLFKEAIAENSRSPEKNTAEIELNGNQANYLLQEADRKLLLKERCSLRIFPEGDRAKIALSVFVKEDRFINIIVSGKAGIDNGTFSILPDSIQVGRLKNAGFMREKLVNRINREIKNMPEKLGLPFDIWNMEIENSKIRLKLKLKSGMMKNE